MKWTLIHEKIKMGGMIGYKEYRYYEDVLASQHKKLLEIIGE